MKLIHVVVITLRLFAICLAIYVTKFAISAVMVLNSGGSMFPLFYILQAGLIIFCIFIWVFPLSIAKTLTGYKDIKKPDESFTADQFADVAFSTLGIYLLFSVFSNTIYWVYFFQNIEAYGPSFELSMEQKASIITTVAEAIFVVGLLLGRKTIFRMIKKMKSYS